MPKDINTFQKDFDGWNEFQKKLEFEKLNYKVFSSKTGKYLYKEGEIWYCSVGTNLGSEICGKNNSFERPVLIIRKSKNHFVCLPLTSSIPNNPEFYFDISFFDTDSSARIDSFVVLTTPMTLDAKRLSRKIRRIRDGKFVEIKNKLCNYLKNVKNDPPK
jgi:mRNA interferase MazF